MPPPQMILQLIPPMEPPCPKPAGTNTTIEPVCVKMTAEVPVEVAFAPVGTIAEGAGEARWWWGLGWRLGGCGWWVQEWRERVKDAPPLGPHHVLEVLDMVLPQV
jgi:hypothetical protein